MQPFFYKKQPKTGSKIGQTTPSSIGRDLRHRGTGSLKFDYNENDDNMVDNKFNIEMINDLYIGMENNGIIFIEKNIDNIEVEIKTHKLVSVKEQINQDNGVYFYTYIPSMKDIVDKIISDLNNYKIFSFENNITSVKIYASKENISKLKNNFEIRKQKNY